MRDILNAICHDGPRFLSLVSNLDNPDSAEERRLAPQLRAVDEEIAETLKPSICALADKQAKLAFCSGVRFGAQLMAQLMEDV